MAQDDILTRFMDDVVPPKEPVAEPIPPVTPDPTLEPKKLWVDIDSGVKAVLAGVLPDQRDEGVFVDDAGMVVSNEKPIFDGDVERLSFLPYYDEEKGLIAPQIVVDMVRAFQAPGRALGGEILTAEEAANFALSFSGSAIGSALATKTGGPGVVGIARTVSDVGADLVKRLGVKESNSVINTVSQRPMFIATKEMTTNPGIKDFVKDSAYKTEDGTPYILFRGSRNKEKFGSPLSKGRATSRSFGGEREFGVHVGTRESSQLFSSHYTRFPKEKVPEDMFEPPDLTSDSVYRRYYESFKEGGSLRNYEEEFKHTLDLGNFDIPFIVNAKKPLVLHDNQSFFPLDVAHQVLKKAQNRKDGFTDSDAALIDSYINKYQRDYELSSHLSDVDFQKELGKKLQRLIESKGYDHIAYINKHESPGDLSFIFWKPGQLKSVTSPHFNKETFNFVDEAP